MATTAHLVQVSGERLAWQPDMLSNWTLLVQDMVPTLVLLSSSDKILLNQCHDPHVKANLVQKPHDAVALQGALTGGTTLRMASYIHWVTGR